MPTSTCRPSLAQCSSLPVRREHDISHGAQALLRRRRISGLPQQLDLLERYRGLVALGRVIYDEGQVRTVAQLRRLQRDLEGYAPPALASHYLNDGVTGRSRSVTDGGASESHPWWAPSEPAEGALEAESGALVRVRTHAEEIASLTTPKGLLLTGPPGSGKSFLIDLWFAAVPAPHKTRKHYSELVLEVYRAVWEETRRRMAGVHSESAAPPDVGSGTASIPWSRSLRERWRALPGAGKLPSRWVRRATPRRLGGSAPGTVEPPIAFVVAQRLILRHWLLVFDEIQLLDVSSAALLADVLSWFWRMGGVVVGSSNRVPDDLYKNGVQRGRLEPFVEALKARCPVVVMRSEREWRVERAGARGTDAASWFVRGQEDAFERKLVSFAGPNVAPQSAEVVVFGRRIHVPWSAGGACKLTFSRLCEESLGPADYITLASTYHTVAITGIPVLRLSDKNPARRFISLTDALYEARCRIVCLAETSPDNLFFPDAPAHAPDDDAANGPSQDVDVMMAEAVAETRDVYRPNVSSYDAPNMAEAPNPPNSALALDMLSIFSGKDEQSAFKRALSRLVCTSPMHGACATTGAPGRRSGAVELGRTRRRIRARIRRGSQTTGGFPRADARGMEGLLSMHWSSSHCFIGSNSGLSASPSSRERSFLRVGASRRSDWSRACPFRGTERSVGIWGVTLRAPVK